MIFINLEHFVGSLLKIFLVSY